MHCPLSRKLPKLSAHHPGNACLRELNHRDQDRQRQLKRVGHEFASWYGRCLTEGTPATATAMFMEADPFLEVVAAHPLKSSTFKVTLQAPFCMLWPQTNLRWEVDGKG